MPHRSLCFYHSKLLSIISLFFEQEIHASLSISHSMPRTCPFQLWNSFRVHPNDNGPASLGGFATLGFDMESFQDSSLSVLFSFWPENG